MTTSGQSVGVRHAFRGNRWEGQASLQAVCGEAVALARPSEMDWVLFPTCADCNAALKSGHDGQVR